MFKKNKTLIIVLVVLFVVILTTRLFAYQYDKKLKKKLLEQLPIINANSSDVIQIMQSTQKDDSYEPSDDAKIIYGALSSGKWWSFNDEEDVVIQVIDRLTLPQIVKLFDYFQGQYGIDLYKVLILGESSGGQSGFNDDETSLIRNIIIKKANA